MNLVDTYLSSFTVISLLAENIFNLADFRIVGKIFSFHIAQFKQVKGVWRYLDSKPRV